MKAVSWRQVNPALNKLQIVRNALPVRYQHAPGITFCLKSKEWVSLIPKIIGRIRDFNSSEPQDSIEILKNIPAHTRLLFRVKPHYPAVPSVIVKIKNLHKLRLRIKYAWMKYHRYSFAEAANLITAADRGIVVPQVYGYGTVKNRLGLTARDVVLLEDLGPDCITTASLLEQNRNNPGHCDDILDAIIPVFIAHYNAGCNNWDINQDSVIFVQKHEGRRPLVLDFEFVEFYDQPSMENLMFLAGRYTQHLPRWIEKKQFDGWMEKILDALAIEDTKTRKEWAERFNFYYDSPVIAHKKRQMIM